MIKFLDLYAQYRSIQPEIDDAMAAIIRDSAYVGGAALTRFEEHFAAYQQVPHCVGVANGTDAIEIVLEALGVPAGAEVIVPANSFIASSESVTRAGCRVVFADIDPRTYTLDPADVALRVTERTRAILAVHLYGQPCDMEALDAIAAPRGLHVIEDAAQAHGAELAGRRVGGLGTAATFSFYPGKNLGAYGDAGAITTTDEALARRCRMIANHGRVAKYDHEFEGRNSRLDGLQAAVLDVKLRHLDGWIEHRRAVAGRYRQQLAACRHVVLPVERAGVRHAYHLFVIRSPDRDGLAAHLRAQGIETGIHYPIALPKLKAYAHHGQADAAFRANEFDRQLLSLPMGEHVSEADVDQICAAIMSFGA